MKKILVVLLCLCLLLPTFAFAGSSCEPQKIEYQVWNITDGELVCTYTTESPWCPAPMPKVETTVRTTTTVETTVYTPCPFHCPCPSQAPMDDLHIELYGIRKAAIKQLKKFMNRLEDAETGWSYVVSKRVRWKTGRYILKISLRNDKTGEIIKIYQCVHKSGKVYYTTDYYTESGNYEPEWILGTGVDSIIDTLRHRIKCGSESQSACDCSQSTCGCSCE